ncbi:MAG: GDP-mannose 4,6-dehydratase [Planctomycetaceae bacterium]|nr:GDP-mannose 4,6-dehydratase [Planctomycetaceae bacterium]
MNRRALITGVTGQDGSYLAELLLSKGYDVFGVTRDVHSPRAQTLRRHIAEAGLDASQMVLDECDLTSLSAVSRLCEEVQPDEIYSLAAQSQVGASFDRPWETLQANAAATLILLEAVREFDRRGRNVRIYHASSSEMFGAPAELPQTESTRFYPRSPYACAKVYAYYQIVNYREAHGLFACNGILYNHESPRRPTNYVTRKITQGAAHIAAGLQETLTLGNLDVGRDWGYAKEYVEAMWRMLQQDAPDDFIIATGEWHTLEEFLDRAFQRVGLDWRDHVQQDPALMRPTEVTRLQGDISKACEQLGWVPATRFEALVDLMVDADITLAETEVSTPRQVVAAAIQD